MMFPVPLMSSSSRHHDFIGIDFIQQKLVELVQLAICQRLEGISCH
ncbi:hypothetical protein [Nitrosomonas eutropha]|nr:hypothetical protein [Nitrosomonas eutropha]